MAVPQRYVQDKAKVDAPVFGRLLSGLQKDASSIFLFFFKRFVSRMPLPARANYYTSSLPVRRITPWTRARRGLLTGGDLSHL